MGKKSSRAQKEGYTPIDKVMHDAKVKARESDAAMAEKVRQQSSLLKAMTDAKDKDVEENK
tara:strand:+ start:152 stop:334 length:183 start_codon:yes stop_codon:yes gene_type:complete